MADPQGQSDSVMNPFGLPPEEPGYSYGTLWPVRHKIDANGNQTGSLEWGYLPEALRGAVNDMGIALTAPGNALQGKIPQGQMPDVAQHAAMGMVGMGLPLGMGAPAGAVGVFGGKMALTADHAALQEAENLEGKGIGPEEIHRITGWFRSPGDQKWRFTIPDKMSGIQPGVIRPNGDELSLPYSKSPTFQPLTLPDVLMHPRLYEAYPHLRDYEVHPTFNGEHGSVDSARKIIYVDPRQNPDEALATALHEIQHDIQHREGFARGGSPDEFMPPGANWDEMSGLNPLKNLAFQSYQNLAGEVESRAVEEQLARRDWSKMPQQMEGYPQGPQTVRFRGKSFKVEPVKDDPFGGLTVARKLPSGEVMIGKPGHIHADLLGNLDDLRGFLTNDIDDQMGFADKEGNFYSRSEAKAELAKRKQSSE